MVRIKDKIILKSINNIDNLPSRSGNKTLYSVMVSGDRQFVTRMLEQKANCVEFVGYEIPHLAVIRNVQDAIEQANKGNRELVHISFPWQKIESVRNVTYTLPQ